MDSVLRPRDIQARIRAGESPEDVAAAAQTSVDRIMGFATPVLAERAYQAELAQKASVRRRAATAGPVGHLGQAVDAYLEPHGLASDDVEWDAWRREDGRWTVLATFLSGAAQQTARFTFDPGGRYVVAENDEARSLVGERTADAASDPVDHAAPAVVPEPTDADAAADPGRAVPGDQLALGDDTLGMVLGRPTAPEAPARPAVAPSADADWIVTQASERPEAPVAAAAAPEPDPAGESAVEAADESVVEPTDESVVEAADEPDVEPEPAPDLAPEAEPFEEALFAAPPAPEPDADQPADAVPEDVRPARSARSRGRASVPSWDEIMFGTPKDQ